MQVQEFEKEIRDLAEFFDAGNRLNAPKIKFYWEKFKDRSTERFKTMCDIAREQCLYFPLPAILLGFEKEIQEKESERNQRKFSNQWLKDAKYVDQIKEFEAGMNASQHEELWKLASKKMSEKYSGGPNLSATFARGTPITMSPTTLRVPAMKEPKAEIPRAGPALPCKAIW